MYPGHLEDTERLIYVFINAVVLIASMHCILLSSLLLIVIATLVSVSVSVYNGYLLVVTSTEKQWVNLFIYTFNAIAAFIIILLGAGKLVQMF